MFYLLNSQIAFWLKYIELIGKKNEMRLKPNPSNAGGETISIKNNIFKR